MQVNNFLSKYDCLRQNAETFEAGCGFIWHRKNFLTRPFIPVHCFGFVQKQNKRIKKQTNPLYSKLSYTNKKEGPFSLRH